MISNYNNRTNQKKSHSRQEKYDEKSRVLIIFDL